MNGKRLIAAFLSWTLTCGAVHAFSCTVPSVPAAAEAVGGFENPCNKQDDKEVPYDASRWVQPPEWNCPALNAKDFDGYIMLFFDKIGLEPDYARGKTQRIYFSAVGAEVPVNQIKFHIFYDTRLRIQENSSGNPVNPGKAVESFTTGSAMIEDGQIAFYAYSPEDVYIGHGSLFTIDFIIPETAEPGEFYPIGISYVDDGIAHDTFLNTAQDEAGKLQMTYAFTKGITNGYFKMKGEKKTTAATTSAPSEPLRGDVNCDGALSAADAVLLCRIAAEDCIDDFPLSEQSFLAADYDENGLITVLDAAKLLAYLQTQIAE